MKKKVLIFSSIFLLIDIISKVLIDRFLSLAKSYKLLDMFIYITKTYNDGISFSLLSGKRILIIIISIILLYVLLRFMKSFKENNRNMIAFSMIFGGLIGNLIDRIIYGYVIDFIDIYIVGYNFPVFNFADMFICMGIGLLIYAIFKGEDNENSSRRKRM